MAHPARLPQRGIGQHSSHIGAPPLVLQALGGGHLGSAQSSPGCVPGVRGPCSLVSMGMSTAVIQHCAVCGAQTCSTAACLSGLSGVGVRDGRDTSLRLRRRESEPAAGGIVGTRCIWTECWFLWRQQAGQCSRRFEFFADCQAQVVRAFEIVNSTSDMQPPQHT